MFTSHRAAVSLSLIALFALPAAFAQARLTKYETKYYTIYTDLDREDVREVEQRVTTMAEEYRSRTQGFAGQISKKLPFYLFQRQADYLAAGGLPGTAGVFTGDKLMAIAGSETSGETWHVVQHEGFHQFLRAVVGGDIPIWVNEGLAEYFGQALWTGDGYVLGAIPPDRLARVKLWIKRGHAISIQEMMKMPHELWNAQMSIVNYDQAWSMVYFLAHAENGRFQKAFNGFLTEVSRGTTWDKAWEKNFGRGVREFEQKWQKYWEDMNADPTADLYARATVLTLTSFFARAFAQAQYFETSEAFFSAAESRSLKSAPEDALPPGLLAQALIDSKKTGTWSVEKRGGKYTLICTLKNGQRLAGKFEILTNRRVKSDSVKVEAMNGPAPAPKPAEKKPPPKPEKTPNAKP